MAELDDNVVENEEELQEDEFIQQKKIEKQTERGRKRMLHPELWKVNVAKRLRSQVSRPISSPRFFAQHLVNASTCRVRVKIRVSDSIYAFVVQKLNRHRSTSTVFSLF